MGITYQTTTNGNLPFWLVSPSVGPAPTVLFLHGWGVAPWVYRELLNRLGEEFRVFAPCLPGLCWVRSGTTMSSHRDIAAQVARFCAARGIERAHVVGQSTGGGVAACLAVLHPGLVRSLTLIDCTGGRRRTMLQAAFGIVFDIVLNRLKLWRPMTQAVIIGSFLRNLVGAREQMLLVASIALREPLDEIFGALTLPTLILWGGWDLLFPESVGRDIASRIDGSTVNVDRYGEHLWSICRQREAARYIVAFLKATGP